MGEVGNSLYGGTIYAIKFSVILYHRGSFSKKKRKYFEDVSQRPVFAKRLICFLKGSLCSYVLLQ